MKFSVNTKPLIEGLNLGIINANVSRFFQKSCVAQVRATANNLYVNLEASAIATELTFVGHGDEAESSTLFVDSLLFKQLVSTFEAGLTELEFADDGLVLRSGKSKFTLPKVIDDVDLRLESPVGYDKDSDWVKLSHDKWKFIKDCQMYAIATSFVRPVYQNVWLGKHNEVIVGDFDNSIFTFSKQGGLSTTCLVTDTIINLLNSLPDNTVFCESGTAYLLSYESDSYKLYTKFCPKYESDEDVGSYNSEIIMNMFNDEGQTYVSCLKTNIDKALSQAMLLSSDTDATIELSVSGAEIALKDTNVDAKIATKTSIDKEFKLAFKTALLKSVLSNQPDEEISIRCLYNDDVPTGIIIKCKDLMTVIAGVE